MRSKMRLVQGSSNYRDQQPIEKSINFKIGIVRRASWGGLSRKLEAVSVNGLKQ
jgi:hypothetical protein